MPLIYKFAEEGDAQGAQEESAFPVVRGGRTDRDVTAGYHLSRIPRVYTHTSAYAKMRQSGGKQEGRKGATRKNAHIIISLDLRKQGDSILIEAEGEIAAAVARSTLDAMPVLDAGHDDVDALIQEVIHILAPQLRLDRDELAFAKIPLSDVAFGLTRGGSHARDGLYDHPGGVEVSAVILGRLDHRVQRDFLEPRDVAEGGWFLEEAQDVAAAGSAPGAVLVVG